MKELSVVVLGEGRWARALTAVLTHNQQKQRGRIQRIFAYNPPPTDNRPSLAPAQLPAAVVAESHDATMQLTASALAGLATPVPGPLKVQIKSDSADATMMHMTAESLAGLAGLGAPTTKAPKLQIKSDSTDATMMHMTAESLAGLAGLGAPTAKVPKAQIKSDSNDATMMHMTAESLAGLAGLGAPTTKVSKTQIKSDSNDATMMHMTAESLAGLGAPTTKAPKAQIKSDSNDATMMHMTAESLAGLAGLAGAPKAQVPRTSVKSSSDDATMMHMTAASLAGAVGKAATAKSLLAEVGTADLVLLAAPASEAQALLRYVGGALRPTQMLVHCVDGFHPADMAKGLPAMLISQVISQETPITRIGALAGPALPEDLEEWCPCALVCGSTDEGVASATRQVLGCTTLRIYSANDLVGVEVARAMSCVVAFASGICDVLEFGIATRATLVSRSSAEIARIGNALGGDERTFLGLAGIGGLMVASERRESIDFRLGRLIGAGIPLADALKQLGQPSDVPNMVRDAYGVAHAYSLVAPIVETLYRMVFGVSGIAEALRDLLGNPNFQE